MTSFSYKTGIAVMAVGALSGLTWGVSPAYATSTDTPIPVTATTATPEPAPTVSATWTETGKTFEKLPENLGQVTVEWVIPADHSGLTVVGVNGTGISHVNVAGADVSDFTSEAIEGNGAKGIVLTPTANIPAGSTLMLTMNTVADTTMVPTSPTYATGVVVSTSSEILPAFSANVGETSGNLVLPALKKVDVVDPVADDGTVVAASSVGTTNPSLAGSRSMLAPADLPAPDESTSPDSNPASDSSSLPTCDPNNLEGDFDCVTPEPTPESTPEPETAPTLDPPTDTTTTEPTKETAPVVNSTPTAKPTTTVTKKPTTTTTKKPTTTTPVKKTTPKKQTTTKKTIPTVKMVDKKTTVTVKNPDGTTTTKTIVKRVPVSTGTSATSTNKSTGSTSTSNKSTSTPSKVNSGGDLTETSSLYTVAGLFLAAGTGFVGSRRKK